MPHQKIPKQMMAFAIVYDDEPPTTDGPVIRSFASFNVARTNAREATFSIIHEVYAGDDATALALADMRTVIEPEDTIIGYDDRSISLPKSGSGKGQSALRSQRALPMINMTPCSGAIVINDDEGALAEIAHAYFLRFATADDPLKTHMRLAADRAQAIWLYWLWSCARQPERQYLASAYQAWAALERARPVSF